MLSSKCRPVIFWSAAALLLPVILLRMFNQEFSAAIIGTSLRNVCTRAGCILVYQDPAARNRTQLPKSKEGRALLLGSWSIVLRSLRCQPLSSATPFFSSAPQPCILPCFIMILRVGSFLTAILFFFRQRPSDCQPRNFLFGFPGHFELWRESREVHRASTASSRTNGSRASGGQW